MNEKVKDLITELFSDDPDMAQSLIAKGDEINRVAGEMVARGLVADASPAEPEVSGEAEEIEGENTQEPVGAGVREFELEPEAIAAIVAALVAAEPITGFAARMDAIEAGFAELRSNSEEAAIKVAESVTEARSRLEALEKEEDEKRQRWLEDLPARQTTVLRITDRPSKRGEETEESMAEVAARNLKAKGLA